MMDVVRADLERAYPHELVAALLDAYKVMKENYFLGRYESSELNAGKFCEAVVRIIENVTSSRYTPLDTPIPNMIELLRGFERVQADKCDVTYRIHIPRVLAAIYNIRNKRGVGHLGGDVNPNVADARITVAAADWVMSELFRINYSCSLEQAQQISDKLVERKLPLVYYVGNRRRVLNNRLSQKEKVLVLLAEVSPYHAALDELVQWVEPANPSAFRKNVIGELHSTRLIEVQGNECWLLPGGLRMVEDNIAKWSDF